MNLMIDLQKGILVIRSILVIKVTLALAFLGHSLTIDCEYCQDYDHSSTYCNVRHQSIIYDCAFCGVQVS